VTDSTRPDDDSMREVVERSRSGGAPAVGEAVRDRFSSDEVFQRIIAAADEEVTSGSRELFFSGLAAGLAITITFMLYASLTAATDSHPILSVLLYPLGFIYIIIGGYQLYTENTLPPVALTLERLASIPHSSAIGRSCSRATSSAAGSARSCSRTAASSRATPSTRRGTSPRVDSASAPSHCFSRPRWRD